MRRRDFIKVIAGSAAARPLAVRAQQSAMPVIGFLNSVSAQPFANYVAGFRAGLKETGYIDGQNVTIEFRWAEGHYDRLPGMAADLVRRKVAVLVSTGGPQGVVAAKAATSTIPIVFTLGVDPVQLGVVTSLSRPGGNITGVYLFTAAMESKRLGLLRALVPGVQLIAVTSLTVRKYNATTRSHQRNRRRVGNNRLAAGGACAGDRQCTQGRLPRHECDGFPPAVQNVRYWHKADIPQLSSDVRFRG